MAELKEKDQNGILKKVRRYTGRKRIVYILLIVLAVLIVAIFVFTFPIFRVNYLLDNGIISLSEAPDVESRLVNTSAQIVAGFFLLVGLWFTYRRILATERNVEIAQKTLSTSEKGEITERLNNSIAHLNDESLSVTIGGIYGLKRIAEEDEKSAETISEILSSYLTESVTELPTDREHPDVVILNELERSRYDVTQSLKVITELNIPNKIIKIRRSNIVESILNPARISNLFFEEFDFIEVGIISAEIDNSSFTKSLWWDVSKNQSVITNSYWGEATIHHCTIIRNDFIDTIFNRSSFKESHIELNNIKAKSSPFLYTEFIATGIISNTFEGVTFLRCNFVDSPLEANKFSNCHFKKCTFANLDFARNTFKNCFFFDSIFRNTSLRENTIEDCEFVECTLDTDSVAVDNKFTGSDIDDLFDTDDKLEYANEHNTIEP